MSGFVSIVHFDGAPVDPELLQRMTDFMKFRGPDAQQCFVKDNVGFGHTLLRTTFESEHEQQPFTLDGQTWIIADARVDAQADLRTKLEGRGETPQGVTDVELILRAYLAWGEDCVEHLLGDFSFAIWDAPLRRLFCGRDHLGVKPFFYAQLGSTLIVSNTLDCIRQHPRVSAELNDLAIADFLLFEMNMDPATTSFANIQRIPPAHRAVWWAEGKRIERYWTLPIDEPVYYKREEDYTERFRELLDAAVSDRLRTNKVGVFMSGGLDSPTLAATACKILRSRSPVGDVHALTTVFDGFDGNERYFSRKVADYLGVRIHVRDRSEQLIDHDWYDHPVHSPEPVSFPLNLRGFMDEYRLASTIARVWLYGEGPDNALTYEWQPYVASLWRRREYGRLFSTVSSQVLRNRQLPLIGACVAKIRGVWAGDEDSRFPKWLEPGFEERHRLRDRWTEVGRRGAAPTHLVRPVAYRSFTGGLWEAFFRTLDSESTGAPVELRHPFVDLRLLRFSLAVPPIPWCRAKFLIREAMRGLLPEEIRSRPKTPLSRNPEWAAIAQVGLPPPKPISTLGRFVDWRSLGGMLEDESRFRVDVRAYSLDVWLRGI